MTLQMNLVFGALVAQMVVISFLLVPLPHAVRTKIVQGWAALRKSSNYKVGSIFVSGIMVLQFVDCVQKLQRYHLSERSEFSQSPQMGGGLSSEQLASKFYAQRNLYLSGAVLYLGLSIHTVLSILGKLVAKETFYREAQNNTKSDETAESAEEAAALRETIRKREVEISAMKKQIEGVQKAFDLLSEPAERSKND